MREVKTYEKTHHSGLRITEAFRYTDSARRRFFEVMTADVDERLDGDTDPASACMYLALKKSACGKEKDRERSDHSCGYHRGI